MMKGRVGREMMAEASITFGVRNRNFSGVFSSGAAPAMINDLVLLILRLMTGE